MAAIDTVRDLRRAQIIAAARGLIARGGLEALTIARLENELGFTRGVITYHFDGKDEIVEAVLDSAVRDIDRARGAALAGVESGEEVIRIVLRSTLQGFLANVETAHIMLSFWSRITSDKKLARRNAALYGAFRSGVADLLRSGMRSGEFAKAPIDATAALIVGTVMGIAVQVYFEPGAIDAETAIEEAALALIARLCPPRTKRRPRARTRRER